MISTDQVPMKDWVKEDQPVYKMLVKGKNALSDAELLCIIIGGGSCNNNLLELSKSILKEANNDFNRIAKMSIGDLKFLGLTTQKATTLLSAFELGKRRSLNQALEMGKITKSRDAFDIFHPILSDLQYEEFWCILMNRANKVIRTVKISEGGVSGTVVDPKKIFQLALSNHASSMILGHNHPSKSIQASDADHTITKRVKDCGVLLECAVLDHIIVGGDEYYSFADNGAL